MIKQLVGKKGSTSIKSLKEKKLLRWSGSHQQPKTSNGASPGDTRIQQTEELDEVLRVVALYVKQMDFHRQLAAKVIRKFRRHGQSVSGELLEVYKRFDGYQDAGCIEDILLNALPDKHKLRCFRQIYSPLVRNNEFFQALARAVPNDELAAFESRLIQSFYRENMNCGRYLAVSPRGALYIVRRGSVRIYQKGSLKTTLERGSVFEIRCLSDQYVSIHHVHHVTSSKNMAAGGALGSTNSPFDVVMDHGYSESKLELVHSEDEGDGEASNAIDRGAEQESDLFAFRGSDPFLNAASYSSYPGAHEADCASDSSGDEEEGNDVEDLEEEDDMFSSAILLSNSESHKDSNKWTSMLSSSPGRGALSKRRRSLVNAFGLLNRRRSSGEERRGSLSMQAEKEILLLPWSSVSICAMEDDASSSVASHLESQLSVSSADSGVHMYGYGAELGVISSDNFRGLVADFPSVQRNLEVLCVSMEVQIEKEKEAIRRNQEITRKRLEQEHRTALNRKLEQACRAGVLDDVQSAITAGAGINDSLDTSGATALHVAALFGHADVVNLLLRLGADVRTRDKEDRTALHLCCLVSNWADPVASKIINALVEHESSLFFKDQWGNTPLHLAASTGDLVLLTVLMNHVARLPDVSALTSLANQDGLTPLDLCGSLDSRRILKPKTHVVGNLR